MFSVGITNNGWFFIFKISMNRRDNRFKSLNIMGKLINSIPLQQIEL